MAAEFQLTLDSRNLARFRLLLAANRKVAAQSLTFTAERAQEAWRIEDAAKFHLRRPWLVKGVRITHATPNHLEARVGSIDKFFGRHVIGIDEPKDAAGGSLLVPVQPIDQQGTHTQIRAALRRMRGTKTKPFVRNGVLLRRTGQSHDAPLKVLAVFRKTVHIKPRFDAIGVVDRAVQVSFPKVYERLLLKWWDSGAQ